MQPVNMLIINPGYEYISIGFVKNETLTSTCSVHKHQASKNLLAQIDTVLRDNNCSADALTCIAVVVGPGPFTTLRVAIASINGFAYGLNIPLIAIDGFDAIILAEKANCKTPYLGIILNAFSDDVYYAIYNTKTSEKKTGCCAIEELCQDIKALGVNAPERPIISLYGNGITLYEEHIKTIDPAIICLPKSTEDESQIFEAIKVIALNAWLKNDTKKMLLPQYMKATSALINTKK